MVCRWGTRSSPRAPPLLALAGTKYEEVFGVQMSPGPPPDYEVADKYAFLCSFALSRGTWRTKKRYFILCPRLVFIPNSQRTGGGSTKHTKSRQGRTKRLSRCSARRHAAALWLGPTVAPQQAVDGWTASSAYIPCRSGIMVHKKKKRSRALRFARNRKSAARKYMCAQNTYIHETHSSMKLHTSQKEAFICHSTHIPSLFFTIK